MKASIVTNKPQGILRLLLKLPVYMYRVGLGWLLGHRFLMLKHLGRKSGQVYGTVLEVLWYNPRTKESVVMSAWGDRSDWYLNIQVHPALEVSTGLLRYEPDQHLLSPAERRALYARWERRHPLEAWLAPMILTTGHSGSREERRTFVASLPMVAFRPRPKCPVGRMPG